MKDATRDLCIDYGVGVVEFTESAVFHVHVLCEKWTSSGESTMYCG